MTRVYTLAEIQRVLPKIDVVSAVREGFISYSLGKVDVPPVGELLFPDDDGEMHIKYGAIRGDDVFVVKIATGFFGNTARGLPPFGGCMLVLSSKTGMVLSVLLEEGELTNHRTAAAGAVAAAVMLPSHLDRIGIVGTGVQARLQADYLRRVTKCRALSVWGRSAENANAAARDIAAMGFQTDVADSLESLCHDCRLIVTTTPSTTPLLSAELVQPGTHITAMGSDTEHKQELSPELLARADHVVSDSIAQSQERGEVFQARRAGAISDADVVELGTVLQDPGHGRTSDHQITIADLTGVAVQDIAIAKAVLTYLEHA